MKICACRKQMIDECVRVCVCVGGGMGAHHVGGLNYLPVNHKNAAPVLPIRHW
jgi:hypothetical protein